jgi:hypothetical protein
MRVELYADIESNEQKRRHLREYAPQDVEVPELTDSNGVGCAMRPRPAKDEDASPEDPEQV